MRQARVAKPNTHGEAEAKMFEICLHSYRTRHHREAVVDRTVNERVVKC